MLLRCVALFSVAITLASQARASAPSTSPLALSVDDVLVAEVMGTLVAHEPIRLAQAKKEPERGSPPPVSAPPQLSGIGVGLQIGSPSAVTVKFGGIQTDGFVIGVGAGFGRNANNNQPLVGVSLHADYLWHLFTLVRDNNIAVTGYAGAGVWVGLAVGGYGLGFIRPYINNFNYFGVGVRVPLGLSMSFQTAPIEIYLELDPALFVFPGIDFGIGASLGFRYHF